MREGGVRAAILLDDLSAMSVLYPERPCMSIVDVVLRGKLKRADEFQLARAGAFAAWEPGCLGGRCGRVVIRCLWLLLLGTCMRRASCQ